MNSNNSGSEKRSYLEPSAPSLPRSQRQSPDLLGSIDGEDVPGPSSSGPPDYSTHERGVFNSGPSNVYPPNGYQPSGYQSGEYQPSGHQPSGHQSSGHQSSGYQSNEYPPAPYPQTAYTPPPQNQAAPYASAQQLQHQQTPHNEPIRLALINPRMLSSGFSMVMPDRLHQLTRRPIEPSQWTSFMQELNDILRKSPGALAQGVTDFWLVNIATLGLAWTARNMYQSRVEGKATEAVERYNRAEFSAWGIRARFEVVPLCDVATNLSSAVASSRMSRHDRRQMRRGQQGPLGNSGATLQTSTLELVIERT